MRFANDDGISPLSALLLKYNRVICNKFPIVDGMVPNKEALYKLKTKRLSKFPISDGIVPVTPLLPLMAKVNN